MSAAKFEEFGDVGEFEGLEDPGSGRAAEPRLTPPESEAASEPEAEPELEVELEPGAEAEAESEPEAEPEPERKRRGLRSETARRVLWALPWIVFAITIVAVGRELWAASMIVLGVLGLREFFAMTERARPFGLPAYLTLTGMIVAAYYGGPYQVLLLAACGFPLMFVFATRRSSHENVTYSMAITVLGVAWMGLGFSHAVLLRQLPLHGGALVIDVLVATFLGDTAAYGAGRLFGSRKLAPRISPTKTVEGLIGGMIGATMGFWFAGLYQNWLPQTDALVMGLAIAVIAPIGDLFASMIKRDCEVKDTGRLFGPHGGLIDRLDAILFTIVAGYYLSVAFVY